MEVVFVRRVLVVNVKMKERKRAVSQADWFGLALTAAIGSGMNASAGNHE